MKILYITEFLPYPLDSGGKIKTYQTLKLLSTKHQIYLACFAVTPSELKNKGKLEKICYQVNTVVNPFTVVDLQKIKREVFKNFFTVDPFIFRRFKSSKMTKVINEVLKSKKIDAIHIDHFYMSQYLPLEKKHLYVLEEHNINSIVNLRSACKEGFNKLKPFFFLEACKLRLAEMRKISKFDYWLAISKKDKNKLIDFGAKKEKTFFLPTATQTKRFFTFKRKRKTLLFVGLLSWRPNRNGLLWFLKKVLPLIKKKIPQVQVLVVGKEIDKETKKILAEEKHSEFLGYAADLKPIFNKASVFIVPLQSGGGIRIKILTALSHGIPVVFTS